MSTLASSVVRRGVPSKADTGPFETAAYLRASAAHEGTEPVLVTSERAYLPLLRARDGSLHTVYGYPMPFGDSRTPALAALAKAVASLPVPLRLSFSPLGAGAALAAELDGRLPVVDQRAICVADLDGDPLAAFHSGARSKVRRAVRGGVRIEVGAVTEDFGSYYRAAMDVLAAPGLYRFGDAYFAALRGPDAFQVTAYEDGALAAAAVFLARADQASYHLSARRGEPLPIPGAVNLVVLEGLRECSRRGIRSCVLGGGRTGASDDSLLRFKRAMATRVLARPTFGRSLPCG